MSSIQNVFIAGLITIMFAGCMATRPTTTNRRTVDRRAPSRIYLTRTRGQRGKHFSARVSWGNGTFISSPKIALAGGSGQLPPGLTLNRSTGYVSGTPTSSGFWTVSFAVSDRYKGTLDHSASQNWAWESNSIEIKIFDKLTDER